MKKLVCAALATGLGIAGAAWADEGEALAKKSGCYGCHAPDKKLLGPSFKDIAAKYKEDKEAAAKLEGKILNGGSGSWGTVAMPAQKSKVTPDAAKAMTSWILSVK